MDTDKILFTLHILFNPVPITANTNATISYIACNLLHPNRSLIWQHSPPINRTMGSHRMPAHSSRNISGLQLCYTTNEALLRAIRLKGNVWTQNPHDNARAHSLVCCLHFMSSLHSTEWGWRRARCSASILSQLRRLWSSEARTSMCWEGVGGGAGCSNIIGLDKGNRLLAGNAVLCIYGLRVVRVMKWKMERYINLFKQYLSFPFFTFKV